MERIIIYLIVILTINVYIPNQVNAENKLDFYMNDFYNKSNEARLILREIENDIKIGIKKNICSRQVKAAKLGIIANESLIKAFEIAGREPPNSSINESQKRWESLLNDCKNFN
tara:strand:+ start:396 stop:737 length:342 start_codon:yes stop_codon:yes gene_type:complete